MDIAPRDLTYFIATAKCGRLSKAAEACQVTQPALTKAIQRLEAECGLKLFERNARGMRLTPEGEQFRVIAEMLERSYEEAVHVAANVRAQHSGLLRLGSTDTTRASLVSITLSALLRQRPGLRATLRIGQSDLLARAIVEGQLDVAIVPTYGAPPEGCDHVKVGEDPHVPVMSTRHPLAIRSHVAPVDLVPYNWISTAPNKAGFRSLSALFAHHRLPPPTVIVEIEYTSEAVISLLRTSNMLAMIPRSLYQATDRQDLQLVPVPAFRIDREVLCITRAGNKRSPLTAAFCDMLMTHIRA